MTRLGFVGPLLWLVACTTERAPEARPPTYEGEVKATLEQACGDCHEGEEALGGFRVDLHFAILGCDAQGEPFVRPPDEEAPLIAVLDTPSHADVVDEDARALLLEWIEAQSPKFRGTVHPPGIVDPRSDDWHGALAASDGWAPLHEPQHPATCGRCHAGAPVRPEDVVSSAPGATPCTDCHDEPEGALACSTCHGDGERRSYPPRDRCYFDPALEAGAHAAHVEDLQVRARPYACSACHPVVAEAALFEGAHADGEVDLVFDPMWVSGDPAFDDGACAVSCHARGGERPEPRWEPAGDGAGLDCNSCHLSPPREHYEGPCGRCHAEMDAAADSLTPGPLHLNGEVDVGDGGDTCAACHGAGEDGWPVDPVHAAHRRQSIAEPIACAECHEVPSEIDSDGHLDGQVQVVFSGRALREGLSPAYEEGTCSEVACHAAWLRDPAPAPVWEQAARVGCDFCHGAPPPAPHTADPGCSSLLCHGAMVAEWPDGPRITEPGRGQHLDGDL